VVERARKEFDVPGIAVAIVKLIFYTMLAEVVHSRQVAILKTA
jgi:hypothetical protein